MQSSRLRRFVDQLARRKVPQTGAAYAVFGWIVLQVGEVTFEPLHFPPWALTTLVVLVIAGFPVALVLAWFFDLTRAGVRAGGESPHTPASSPRVAPAPLTSAQSSQSSIAVMAFDDMSPDQDQAYLCEGIAEEILNRLARIGDLRVASRTSSFRFKHQGLDAAAVGRELNVAVVLEGSVRKSGDRLRVTTQLIDSATGFQRWSQSFDREMTDIFAIEDDIATSVAEALEVSLYGTHREGEPPKSVEAYDFYLKGLHYFHRWGLRNVRYAIEMFERAVQRDPLYARAWAALADSHAMICMYWFAAPQHLAGALEASQRALQLAPELAEAHVSRGLAHYVHREHEAAAAQFETALAMAPELFAAHYLYGRICFQQGDLERARELFEQAARIRPDDFQAPILLRQIYRSLGLEEKALEQARRGVALCEQHLQLNPDDTRALNLGLGGLADLRQVDKLKQWVERTLALDGDNPDTLYNVACAYALVGEHEPALQCLERAALKGTAIAQWAEHDSDLQSLHDDPRFIDLIERMRRPDAARQ
jgi:adenylate cyclase